MIEHRVTLTDRELTATAVQNNLPVLALAKFLRSLPEDQRPFFKNCRIEAVIPVYMPRGDFEHDIHAMNMDRDQLAWLLKQRPEFKACDDTANNTLATGGKVVSTGAKTVMVDEGEVKEAAEAAVDPDATRNETL